MLWEAEKARLLLEAARYLGETLEPVRVYDRFRELLAERSAARRGRRLRLRRGRRARSSAATRGSRATTSTSRSSRSLKLDPAGGGMQSRVIRTRRAAGRERRPRGGEGQGHLLRRRPRGPHAQGPGRGRSRDAAALMLPVRHEGARDRRRAGDERPDRVLGRAARARRGPGRADGGRGAERAARARSGTGGVEAEAAAKAVAAEREQVARVLAAVGDGIVLVDGAGAIRFWNRAAEVMTGLAAEDVRGRRRVRGAVALAGGRGRRAGRRRHRGRRSP